MKRRALRQRGFSLIELALVLIISGLLLQGALGSVPERIEHHRRQQTDALLQQLRQALIGHLLHRQHLPCPLNDQGASDCRQSSGGVPAVALGLVGAVDEQGRLLDAWHRPLHYHVSSTLHRERAELSWLRAGDVQQLDPPSLAAELELCHTAQSPRCAAADRVHDVVLVVRSEGAKVYEGGSERENRDADALLISAPYSIDSTDGFDDQLEWLGLSEACWWLLRGGLWDSG